MKRKVVSLLFIGLPLLLAAVVLYFPVTAAPARQETPTATTGTQLAQPQQIIIRQQVPLTFTVVVSTPLTGTTPNTSTTNLLGALINSIAQPAMMAPLVSVQSVGVTLTLDLQLTVTDTLTTTVPSTITLTLANQQSITAPVSVTVGAAPAAAVVITLLAPPVSVEEPLTETVTVTSGVTLTPTTATPLTTTVPTTATTELTTTVAITPPVVGEVATITGTVAITANLRIGPDTTFDAAGTIVAGQPAAVVAQNADGTWYLLDNGFWVAAFLIENVQGQLPLATEELVTALRAQTVVAESTPISPTETITATTAPTATTATTATGATTSTTGGSILVPTPTAVTQPVQAPRVTVDANLRSGPGTEFPVIGGTVTGQEINIVARNADASWFQLDNGGWVSAGLVANAPAAAGVPLATEEAATGATPSATPTPLPTPVAAPTTTVLGVRENLYVIRVDGIIDGYDFTLAKIDDLITQAGANTALLQDRAWIVEMTTAITLLRSTSDEVRTLAAPSLFTDAHAELLEAATSFTSAADLLAEGVDQLDTDRLDEAFAEITIGSSLLTRAQDTIDEITP